MSNSKNPFFPRNLDALVEDMNMKVLYLEANGDRLGIPPFERAVIRAQINAVNAAKALTDDRDRRSKKSIETRDRDLLTTKDTLRRITGYFVKDNPNTTPEDYEALHIYRPGGERQRLLPPGFAPGIGQLSSQNSVLTVPFFDATTGKRRKPDGAQFIEAVYRFGDQLPENADSLIAGGDTYISTTSPMRIPFDIDADYKILIIAFRWIGTHGDHGPWSEIYRVVILK
jgi:hypothetical protein